MGFRIINGQAYQVGNIGGIQSNPQAAKKTNSKGSFKELLNKAIDEKQGYTLSKHAEERLKEMNFSEDDMKNIEKGFELAKDKGAKNSVMVYKDVAIIASIENKTIITAVDKSRAQSNVFTNVDSVVIL